MGNSDQKLIKLGCIIPTAASLATGSAAVSQRIF